MNPTPRFRRDAAAWSRLQYAGSVEDVHRTGLRIIWEKAVDLPRFEIPKTARVFAKQRWTGAPLIAGFPSGRGAVLWVAANPGEHGYERFSYIVQSLSDLGLSAPFRSALAGIRHLGAASGCVALLRSRPRARPLRSVAHPGLPSPRNSGLRLDRAAPP